MENFKKLSKVLLITTAITGLMVATSIVPEVGQLTGQAAYAQALASPERAAAALAAKNARPKMRSTTGMGERAAKALTKAQDLMQAEPPDYDQAMAGLKKMNLDRLNNAERAAFYQMMAAVAQSQDKMDEALGYYKQLLAMDSISYSLRDQMTFLVGQIEFSNENYAVARGYLEDWFQYQPTPSMTNLVIFANVYYASGLEEGIPANESEAHFRKAVEFLNWAITKSKAEGKEDKENWYTVLRAIHNNLNEMDKVLEYGELLASRWPKKRYWVQLSGLYAQFATEPGLSEEEIANYEKKQLATFELAHRQGMLDAGRELESMTQMYLYHESPYQASKTLAKSIEDGLSEKSRRNLDLLAMSYINGKDLDDSVEPLSAAAEMADDGNLYMRLANVYLQLDNYEDAAAAIENAINKGGLRRPDQSRLLQGQAYLSLEKFDDARASFREAAKDDRSETMARNMLRYVDNEEKRIKEIREFLS